MPRKIIPLILMFIIFFIGLITPASSQTANVSLRKFPYPYKAGLALSSDIDNCNRQELLSIFQFLATKENTSQNVFNETNTGMGIGLGLEFAHSFWMIPGNFNYIYYFNSSSKVKSTDADFIRTYAHAGYFDQLHSFGPFDIYGGFTRQMGLDALNEMNKAQITPKIYTNHGDANNHQNIAHTTYELGDVPGSVEYHTDKSVYPNGPIRFLWPSFDVTYSIGSAPLATITLADGRKINKFSRYYGPGWLLPNLSDQISYSNLNTLVSVGSYMIIVNHFCLSATNSTPIFDAKNQAALRNLTQRYESGEIYVTTTEKLLWYSLVHDNLQWKYEGDCNSGVKINISAVQDPAFGRFVPTIEDLQGITFYTSCPSKTSVYVNENNITAQVKTNSADQNGTQSVSIPFTHLPHMPEWTSDGYTRKTEYYDINSYNYSINITNIDSVPFVPKLQYIGLHAFDISYVKSGNAYIIYAPDGKTVYGPRLDPNQTAMLQIINGHYSNSIPRITNISGDEKSITRASYDPDDRHISLSFNSTSLASLRIRNFNSLFSNISTITVYPYSIMDIYSNQAGNIDLNSIDISVSANDTVNFTNINFSTENKSWDEYAVTQASVYHEISGFAPSSTITLNKNDEYWQTLTANETGYANFTYDGTYPARFEIVKITPPCIPMEIKNAQCTDFYSYEYEVWCHGIYNDTKMGYCSSGEECENGACIVTTTTTIIDNTNKCTNMGGVCKLSCITLTGATLGSFVQDVSVWFNDLFTLESTTSLKGSIFNSLTLREIGSYPEYCTQEIPTCCKETTTTTFETTTTTVETETSSTQQPEKQASTQYNAIFILFFMIGILLFCIFFFYRKFKEREYDSLKKKWGRKFYF
jgi:hypothetical protein